MSAPQKSNIAHTTIPTKVRKVGNSLGFVLPKPWVEALHVAEGDQLFLTVAPDGSVRLTPYDPAFAEQMDAADVIMRDYRNTLRALSK